MSDKKDDSVLNHEDPLVQKRHADLLRLAELDVIVNELANGCYTVPFNQNATNYDIRKLDKWAKEHAKDPSELTDQELEQFIIPKTSSV
jgi:hypothetical protein